MGSKETMRSHKLKTSNPLPSAIISALASAAALMVVEAEEEEDIGDESQGPYKGKILNPTLGIESSSA